MASNMNEVGMSGLNQSGGMVTEEYLPRLQGRKGLETYIEMKDDPVCGAILFAIDMLIRQVEWPVQQEKEDERKEFIEQARDDLSSSWNDVISEILSMLWAGWSFFEIVYKLRQGEQPETSKTPTSQFNDGKVGWRKFAVRAQESIDKWQFDEQGGLQAFVQRPAPDYRERVIPILKGLLFRPNVYKGNPEGRSIFRSGYRPWYFKKRIEQIEAIGIERDLAGLPVAFVDPMIMRDDADQQSKAIYQSIKELVTKIKRDEMEGVVFPMALDPNGNKLYDFQLMNSGGARQYDTGAIIQRKNQEIAMTVLADFILLGHENVGSFALSADKTELFAVALMSWVNMIAAVLNDFAIPRLLRLNGMSTIDPPKFAPSEVETPPLSEIGTLISTLAGAGMPLFPDDELEAHIRRLAKFPEKPKGDKAAEAEQAAADQRNQGDPEAEQKRQMLRDQIEQDRGA